MLGLGLAMLSNSTFAHNLQIDQLLPAVKVSDYGEIVLNGKDIAFQSWTSSNATWKSENRASLAGRTSAKEKKSSND